MKVEQIVTVSTGTLLRQKDEEISRLETQLAVMRHERAYFKGQAKKWYERNRILENRVRELNCAYYGTMESLRQDLYAIAKRIPLKPRKKWGQRHGS